MIKKNINSTAFLEYLERTREERLNEKKAEYLENGLKIITGVEPLAINNSRIVTETFFRENILTALPKSQQQRKQAVKLKDFYILTANLYRADQNKSCLRVDLNVNHYSNKSTPSRFIIDLVTVMEKLKLIKRHPHFHTPKKSRQTRIESTDLFRIGVLNSPKLVNGFRSGDEGELAYISHRNKKGKPIKRSAPNTKVVNQLRRDLKYINDVNREHEVTVYQDDELIMMSNDLHAVYSENLFSGGRLYTRKNGIQGIYKDSRPNVKINNKSTLELDFGGLHPRLLYASQGIQFDDDPYQIVHKDPKLRGVLKLVLLCLLNCDSVELMTRAVNYELRYKQRLRRIMEDHGLKARSIYEEFCVSHPELKKLFCTGQGLKMANIDSQIALAVLFHFARIRECCLCIHDSFIVARENKDELKEVMLQKYQKITKQISPDNRAYTCPIK